MFPSFEEVGAWCSRCNSQLGFVNLLRSLSFDCGGHDEYLGVSIMILFVFFELLLSLFCELSSLFLL